MDIGNPPVLKCPCGCGAHMIALAGPYYRHPVDPQNSPGATALDKKYFAHACAFESIQRISGDTLRDLLQHPKKVAPYIATQKKVPVPA